MSYPKYTVTNVDGSSVDYEAVRDEEWAHAIADCEELGFALGQRGTLTIWGEWFSFAICPPDRFAVHFAQDTGSEAVDA